MKEQNDKVVANIYQTFDYEKFKVLAENRGQKETKGIKERKMLTLQHMVDSGRWIHEISRVRVNEDFSVIDGAHTLELCRRNNLPVLYEVTDDPHFNEVTRREMIGNVYSINSVTTSWTSQELFEAAVQVKAPLALLMKEIIETEDNYFLWTDLMALLQKDGRYFVGRWRQANMATFEDKELISIILGSEFSQELKHFIKLNLKARIAPKKGMILKAAYEILWHARVHVDPRKFRTSLASIPEHLVQSSKTTTDDGCRRLLIAHYNKSQGQDVAIQAVQFALAHKDAEEPVMIE